MILLILSLNEITRNYNRPWKIILPRSRWSRSRKTKKKKEKITTKLLYQKEHESREVGEHWNRAERSHVYAVMQNPIESDPCPPSCFFLCIADNPTGELSGRGKTITFSTSPPRRAQARYDGQGKIAHGGTDDWIGTKLRYGANFLRLRGRYPFSSLYESHARASHDSSLPFQRLSDR